ncbi:MAG TPA: hypothetical protein DFR83_29200 [Deltaproteobacteria bacterium]|nr:hypothetical protein [Deltaproteobacteria bacterium]
MFELPRLSLEETWSDGTRFRPDALEGDWLLFRRTTRERIDGEPGPVSEDALVGYGPAGLVDLGTFTGEILELYEPFQVVLPAEPKVGAKWSAQHRRGDRQSERSVELVTGEQPGELVSVAEVRRPDGVLVLRNRYVEGEGWVGYEALVQIPGRPSLRMWSEGLTVESAPQ